MALFRGGGRPAPGWVGYVLAAALTALAAGLRLGFAPALASLQPFAFFYLSVALTAWWAGTGPAVFAWLAGLLTAWFMFLEPRFSFAQGSAIPFVVFALIGGILIALVRFARKSESAARDHATRFQAAEAQGTQQNALLHGLAESVLDGILIVSPDGKTLYANERFRRIWNFPPDVLATGSDEAALTWAETQVAEPRQFREGVARAYSRPHCAVQEELVMKDGRVYDRFGAPVVNRGIHYGWVWTFRDITERKRAEEALRQSGEQFRELAEVLDAERGKLTAVIENLPVGVGTGDTRGALFSLNRAGLKIHGLQSEEEMFAGIDQYVRQFELRRLDGRIMAAEEWPASRAIRGEVVRDYEVRLRNRRNGSEHIISYSAVPVRNTDRETDLLVYVMQDLTEKKRAEEQLRRNHDTFYHLIQQNPFGVYVVDADFRLRQVSLGAQKVFSTVRPLLGRDFAEVLRTIWLEPFAGETIARFRHTLDTGEPYAAPTTVERRQDVNEIESYDWRIERITLPDGRYGVVCYFYDLSERLRWEAALRGSEARLKTIVESLAEGLVVVEPDGARLHWNRAALAMHGRDRNDASGSWDTLLQEYELRTLDGTIVPAGQWPIARVIRGERLHEEELLLRHKERDWQRVFCYGGVLVRDDSGEPQMALVSVRDITERKRAEQELRQAHALIESITTGTEDLIAAEDADFRFIYFNDAYRREFNRLWGRDLEVGTSMIDALAPWPEEQRNAREMWSRALTGESFSVTMAFGPSDEEKQTYDLRFNPVYDAHGALIGAAHIIRNVTDEVYVQQALRNAKERAERSRAEQEAIVNSMTEGVAVFDPGGNLLDMNPAGVAMHGFGSEEQFRQHVAEFRQRFEVRDLKGEILPFDQWPVSRMLRGESFSGYELRVSKTDGSRSFIGSFGGAPVRDASGRIVLGVITIHDITAHRESEQALAEARDLLAQHAATLELTVAERTAKLSETVHELEAFSYSLSHDMRAPLRAMRGFAQILEAEHVAQLGPDARMYLKRISGAAARLDQLIQDVLTYSRIVRENIELAPTDIERLVRQLIDENPMLQPPKAELTIESPLHPVLGHEAYLMQVLSNLVYNAVKFVAPGEQPCVRIWTEASEAHVRLCIRDNGIGIPKGAQERMFGMFERLHSDKSYEGTGIGLTIVRKAVERMGGSVGLESEPGRGTTFCVHLQRPDRL